MAISSIGGTELTPFLGGNLLKVSSTLKHPPRVDRR